MENLLKAGPFEIDQPVPLGGWRRNGQSSDRDLAVYHATEDEETHIEQAVAWSRTGTLLILELDVLVQGPCLKKIGPSAYIPGLVMSLDAIGRSATQPCAALDSVEQTLSRPSPNADETTIVSVHGDVCLVTPPDVSSVVARLSLSGQGSVRFSNVELRSCEHWHTRLNGRLIDRLKSDGVLTFPEVEDAFAATPRHLFLPDINPGRAYQDEAIATHFADGGEVAISSSSQPAIMAIMLEQLNIKTGMRVLEIGAGTGYNAAIMALLTGSQGRVYSVDLDMQFCAEARRHLKAAERDGVSVVAGDGWYGLRRFAQFDRIIVTASAHDIAPAWMEQLRDGGRLVLPWGAPKTEHRSLAFVKHGDKLTLESAKICGFMRLRGDFEWSPEAGAAEMRKPWEWLYPGQPQSEPKGMIACLIGQSPAPKPGQVLVRRKWFEYLVTWE